MNIRLAPVSSKARASVVLIILVLLALMVFLVVSNNLALRHLDKNLRLIEQKQIRRAGVANKSSRPSH